MWGLSLPEPPHELLLGLSAGAQDLVARLQASRDLCGRLGDLRGAASDGVFAHGDLRWENCVAVAPPASRRRTRVLLVDWELAARAPPDSTSRASLADYLCSWVESIPMVDAADPARLVAHARRPLPRMQPAIDALWSAYAHAGRGGATLRRVIELTAVRLLQTAVERAQGLVAATAQVVTLAQLADNMLGRPDWRRAGPARAAAVNRYREQVAAAIDAVTIRSPTRYAWLGRPSRALPRAVDAAMDDRERRSYLVACLGQELYWSFYSPGGPVPARWGEPEPDAADAWLVEAMARANTGRGSWEEGWTVERLDGADAVVVSERLRARAAGGRLPCSEGALRPGARREPAAAEGAPGAVARVLHRRSATPSSHWTRSGSCACTGTSRGPAPRRSSERSTSRLNARRRGVPAEGRQSSAAPPAVRRGDPVPGGRRVPAAARGARADRRRLRTRLEPRIPAFTLDLAPGVGLAEGRGDGESFGVRRCELLADGIVRADARGAGRLADRLDEVARRFAEERISIDAPYLEPALAGRHVL